MKAFFPALGTRPPLASALFVFVVLLATTDDRSFGLIPDGQEMLSAGAAVAFGGEIGISRDFVNGVPRDGGDAFSRYGMGQSLAEVPFLWAARAFHAISPALPAAPILVLLPILSLTAAAWGVSRASGLAGVSTHGQFGAGTALVLATPLWGYAGSDFSEPLQVALIGLSLAALGALREAPSRRRALLAGLLIGLLPLVKSLLWIVALPLLVIGLFPRPVAVVTTARVRRGGPRGTPLPTALPLALGALVPVASWLVLELVRFGAPFGGYPGEDFSYPGLVGLLRLTVFPNKGLFVYAPIVLLALPGTLALRRRDPALALGVSAAALAVLVTAANWWAWDGQAAWGPRLVLPVLPLALLASAVAYDTYAFSRGAGRVCVLAGLLLNASGSLQPFAPVYALVSTSPEQPIPEDRAKGTPYEILRRADGVLVATPPHHLSLSPGWWPPLVHARLLRERLAGGDVPRRLAAGALDLQPPLAPSVPGNPTGALEQAVSPFVWPFWGRSFIRPMPGSLDPFRQALYDQAVRNLDSGRFARARKGFSLVLEREGRTPSARTLALAAEAAGRSGDPEDAGRLLDRSPSPCHPWIQFVRAGRGEDVSPCVPAAKLSGFLSDVEAARRSGLSVSGWARAVTRRAEAG